MDKKEVDLLLENGLDGGGLTREELEDILRECLKEGEIENSWKIAGLLVEILSQEEFEDLVDRHTDSNQIDGNKELVEMLSSFNS